MRLSHIRRERVASLPPPRAISAAHAVAPSTILL